MTRFLAYLRVFKTLHNFVGDQAFKKLILTLDGVGLGHLLSLVMNNAKKDQVVLVHSKQYNYCHLVIAYVGKVCLSVDALIYASGVLYDDQCCRPNL